MKYVTFRRIYTEALSYEKSEFDNFVADRGWQKWMDEYQGEADQIIAILEKIYKIAWMSIGEMREELKLSRIDFSAQYQIPIRTLEHWEKGDRLPPDYVLCMLAYTVFTYNPSYDDEAEDEDK